MLFRVPFQVLATALGTSSWFPAQWMKAQEADWCVALTSAQTLLSIVPWPSGSRQNTFWAYSCSRISVHGCIALHNRENRFVFPYRCIWRNNFYGGSLGMCAGCWHLCMVLMWICSSFFFLFGCYYAHFRNFTNPSVAKMCIVTGLFTVFSMILFSE